MAIDAKIRFRLLCEQGGGNAAVPEPTGLLLCCFAILALIRERRRTGPDLFDGSDRSHGCDATRIQGRRIRQPRNVS